MSKTEWLKKCQAILKAVKGHKHAWIFAEPVDPVKLNIPDYFTIIKKPMDLGTVKMNMDSGAMTTPEQFKDDMLLTFANAMKYNPPEHDVHKMAKALSELFVSKWEKEEDSIKQKWRMESSGGHHTPSAPGAHSSESVGKRLMESDFKDDSPMTYEEKRELSANMNKLPGKKLGAVVQIIHDRNPKILQQNGDDPDEIEVDIDKIDDATLRFLDNYVKDALAKKKKKTGA